MFKTSRKIFKNFQKNFQNFFPENFQHFFPEKISKLFQKIFQNFSKYSQNFLKILTLDSPTFSRLNCVLQVQGAKLLNNCSEWNGELNPGARNLCVSRRVMGPGVKSIAARNFLPFPSASFQNFRTIQSIEFRLFSPNISLRLNQILENVRGNCETFRNSFRKFPIQKRFFRKLSNFPEIFGRTGLNCCTFQVFTRPAVVTRCC